MARARRPRIESVAELWEAMRDLRRDEFPGPFIRARDLALAFDDTFEFAGDLLRWLTIEALTVIARDVIHRGGGARSRDKKKKTAHASGDGFTMEDDEPEPEPGADPEPEFAEFEEICRACPRNYALPGHDRPEDTRYAETFDAPCAFLQQGAEYLRKMAAGAQRNAAALEALFRLCQRFGFADEDTPRDVLSRRGYQPPEGE